MTVRSMAALVGFGLMGLGGTARAQGTEVPQVRERWTLAGVVAEAGVQRDGAVLVRVDGGAWRRVGVGSVGGERVDLGGAEALVVRVEGDQPGLSVLYGSPTNRAAIVHAAPAVTQGEDVADRAVTDVVILPRAGGGRRILLGQRRTEVTLCGLGAPLTDTRALDPASGRWEPVAVDPLSTLAVPERGEGTAIAAVPYEPAGRAAGVPLLLAQSSMRGGISGGPQSALHDGRGETAWPVLDMGVSVARVLPSSTVLERVILQAPPQGASLPRALTLVVGAQRFEVTIDPSLARPGARVAIPLVPARASACVALLARGAPSSVGAAIAEVSVGSALDREQDPIGTLVRALGDAPDEAASEALALLGARAVPAIAAALPTLDARGARRAIRLLALRGGDGRAAEALVGALARSDIESVARDAVVRLGPVALDALSQRVVTDGRAADVILALRADRLARARAMLPALSADPPVWRRARGPLRALLADCDEGAQRAWLDAARVAAPRAVLRAASVLLEASALEPVRREASTAAMSVDPGDFSLRFLRLGALAGSAEGVALLAASATGERDPDLRLEAVRGLGSTMIQVSQARSALERALGDAVPRVRAEAIRLLPVDGAARPLIARSLQRDRWPRVRAVAAERLAGDAGSAAVLLDALEDPSVPVVQAALSSLERTPSAAIGPRLLAFARDASRNPTLRIDALGALGARCDRAQVQEIEALAVSQLDPALPELEQRVGHAALAAVARIDPARARAALARMDANGMARSAIEVAARGACPAR
jgi:hypothetical protein